MSFEPIYRGWDIPVRLWLKLREFIAVGGIRRDQDVLIQRAHDVRRKVLNAGLSDKNGIAEWAWNAAFDVMMMLGVRSDRVRDLALFSRVTDHFHAIVLGEDWFSLPTELGQHSPLTRSELWEVEDAIKRTEQMVDDREAVFGLLRAFGCALLEPLIERAPGLLEPDDADESDIRFDAALIRNLNDLPDYLDHLIQACFTPELDQHDMLAGLRQRLEYNLTIASGGNPADTGSLRYQKLPSRAAPMPPEKLVQTHFSGTPFPDLLDISTPIVIPQRIRTEHQHIVAGSGQGKTQTLQHFILHDLEAVERGEASMVVIDSQSDLIENIAGLECFAPGQPLADRLIVIDPTDIEYPVALNLFDAGLDRLEGYSPLEREKLTNSILELYDFVLGSLLDAGMTQKQNVIFRYITRLLLHIPDATIHTLRELLEDGGYDTYRPHMDKLEGTARAFFDNEFMSKEFTATKKQVLRRLYGILENQTFERMFSHPKSKLDLFSEMNAGKVILINSAKDLLKENGTQIFGRFFIAFIAQAAQERATLPKSERLFTAVYVDEAQDYFDQNTAVILSQARKYNIGMVLAHQYLGQLDAKLQEAVFTNSSIKFAGGVSAKDARTLAPELRTDANFIESQPKLSFASFIAGETNHAVSLTITPGEMEARPRMNREDRQRQRDHMREQYAVHYLDLGKINSADINNSDDNEVSQVSAEEKRVDALESPETKKSNEPDMTEPEPWD